jgi:hypothetical protein
MKTSRFQIFKISKKFKQISGLLFDPNRIGQ